MKIARLLFSALMTFGIAVQVNAEDPKELVDARTQFEKEMAELEAAFFNRRSELILKHAEVLKKAEEFYTKKGELETAIKVKEEVARLEEMFRESSLKEIEAIKRQPAEPETPSAPAAGIDTRGLRPGLVVREYGRQPTQVKDKGFLKFGDIIPLEPVGEKRIISSLTPWNYADGRNAVALGYLKIDAPGEYEFNSFSYYDRNALYVEGTERPLCGYRDGEGKVQKIKLDQGVVRIISIGFVDARGNCRVRWKPPGAEGLGPIPPENLFHTREDLDGR